MEELKSLFAEGSLTYDEFSQRLGEAGDTIKLANLKSGNYVDKAKYDKAEKDVENLESKFNALSEKTKDYDELKTKYETLNTDYAQLRQKQDEADKMNMVKDAKVDSKFAKFVYSEVSSQVNGDKDFKTALTEYLKDNKQYVVGSQGTYVDLQNGIGKTKTDDDRINEQIRNFRR